MYWVSKVDVQSCGLGRAGLSEPEPKVTARLQVLGSPSR